MLKNIGNLFENKKAIISKSQDRTDQIKEQLLVFFKSKFGDSLKGLSLGISYNPKDKSLIINPNSKVLANELALKLADLHNFLKEKNIILSRILIK